MHGWRGLCGRRRKKKKALNDWPQGKQWVLFPREALNVPLGFASGNFEVEGKQNSLFPQGPVIKCFVIPPDSNVEKAPKKMTPLHTLAALAKLSGCQNQPVLSKNHVIEFWPMARDTFSSNQEAYLSWEVFFFCLGERGGEKNFLKALNCVLKPECLNSSLA